MKSLLKLKLSTGLIGLLLIANLLPTQTESTTAGWVIYGIIIGLLLNEAIRATNNVLYERSYKRSRYTSHNRSR